MANDNGRFTMYADYIIPVRDLSDEEAGRLFKAVLAYVNGEEVPELNGKEKIAYSFIQVRIEADRGSYEKKCRVNRENGAKGGRPKKKQEPQNSDEEKPNGFLNNRSVSEAEPAQQEEPEKEAKPAKPKKPKPEKKKYAEFVSMTEAEYGKLVEGYGEDGAKRMIEILDNYKGASARKYASDYRAILNWVVKRYQEEQEKEKQKTGNRNSAGTGQVDTDEDWTRFFNEGWS